MRNLHKALEVLIRPLQTSSPTVNSFIVAVSSVSADALKTLLEQEATIARLTAELDEARLEFAARRDEFGGGIDGWSIPPDWGSWARTGRFGRVIATVLHHSSSPWRAQVYVEGRPIIGTDVQNIRDGMRWADAELRKAGLL